MHTINIHEAKTNLSRLVEEAASGKSFIIAKAGKPMVKVVPFDHERDPIALHRIGFMAGEISVPDDFDHMGEDNLVALFEGENK